MQKTLKALAPILTAVAVMGCGRTGQPVLTLSGLNPDDFASTYRGDSTQLITLTNASGAEVCITNFGGRIVSVMMPDREGRMRDVVIGFDSVASYFPERNLTDFGATIGRYANRIRNGRFILDGDTAILPRNNYGHCLHGGGEMGSLGWQYRVFDVAEQTDSSVVLTLHSADGDNGFPGAVDVSVNFTLRADNAIDIAYTATTDAPTVINMTNHAYFNLAGDPSLSMEDSKLTVNAGTYTPVDSTFIPLGELATVEDTPFDFRQPRTIGSTTSLTDNQQVNNAHGIDHNWVLDTGGSTETVAASLYSPSSGIAVDVYTSEPGIQIYSGNFLDGTVKGKKGIAVARRGAVCLETQHYPDSPNHPEWPSVVLKPGETYTSRCIYRFTTR